jgi:L-asparaginase II
MKSAILAEVRRGQHVESIHSGSVVVCDTAGAIVFSAGDVERAAFPRSSIKALQALPLVAGGAADRFGLTPAELALACASHTGLPVHAQTASGMLAKAGCDVACLECGTHWPSSASAARALAASGGAPSALHNNCSGKHAGFVCSAVAGGRDPRGYILPDHPVMRAVIDAVASVTGAAMTEANRATDGCSIPTFLTPLRALATGFAKFGAGAGLPEGFAAAAARLRAAVAANPLMLAGEGRFDTEVTAALGEKVFVKGGAEGVVAGAVPGLGLGFALKIDDGAARAADTCAAAVLTRLLGDHAVLAAWRERTLPNWNKLPVASISASKEAVLF